MIESNHNVINYIAKKACDHDYFMITFAFPQK